MAPAVTRSYTLVYGSLTVGGSTDYLIPGKVTFTKGYETSTVAFQVLVQSTSDATFATNCATVEAAFRLPRQAFSWTVNSQTHLSFTHSSGASGNTGFNAAPTITKSGAKADTGNSRLYDVSITFQMPADLSGQSGRQSGNVVVDYDPSRRIVITITGRYTALASNNAKAQYDAAIGSYSSAALSAYGSGLTFDLVREDINPDESDKVCDFTRVYQQVLYAPTSGGLSHASIRSSSIRYARQRPAPGDSPGKSARRLETVAATIDCHVDNTVTTGIWALYADSIRPYLISQAQSKFSPSSTAIVDEVRDFDPSGNRLTATLTFQMVIGGGGTISYTQEVGVDNQMPVTLQDVHSGSDFGKYKFSAVGRRVRTTTEVERKFGLFSVNDTGSGFSGGAVAGGGGGGAAGGGGGGGGGNANRPTLPSTGGAGRGGTTATAATASGVITSTIRPPSNVNPARAKSAAGGADGGAGGGAGGGGGAGSAGSSGWAVMSTTRRALPLTLGVDQTFDVTDLLTITVEEYYEEPGSASSGPVTTPTVGNSGPGSGGQFGSPGGAITPTGR